MFKLNALNTLENMQKRVQKRCFQRKTIAKRNSPGKISYVLLFLRENESEIHYKCSYLGLLLW